MPYWHHMEAYPKRLPRPPLQPEPNSAGPWRQRFGDILCILMYFMCFFTRLLLNRWCKCEKNWGSLALFAPNPWWHPGSFCNRMCTFTYIFVQAPCGITESHQEFQEDWCWNQRRAASTEKIRQSVSATAEALGPVAPIKHVPPRDFAMTRYRQQR